MGRFLYTAWFRDLTAEPDDEDREWPACFIVEASDGAQAQAWGDQLAQAFSARRRTEQYLESQIEPSADEDASLPIVSVGCLADDSEIGW
ncbi:MAG TPA: hypothetical protein VGR02_01990 [Thermoanaerobaculia bacterium]|jgi:hypothetical protein|nr:hypothetical protein [Thermoanaerobaculia bacterium]